MEKWKEVFVGAIPKAVYQVWLIRRRMGKIYQGWIWSCLYVAQQNRYSVCTSEISWRRSIKMFNSLAKVNVLNYSTEELYVDLAVLNDKTSEISWNISPHIINTENMLFNDLYSAIVQLSAREMKVYLDYMFLYS